MSTRTLAKLGSSGMGQPLKIMTRALIHSKTQVGQISLIDTKIEVNKSKMKRQYQIHMTRPIAPDLGETPCPEMIVPIVIFHNKDHALEQYPRFRYYTRVRFEEVDDDAKRIRALVAHAASPSRKSSTQEERNRLWWSRSEMARVWSREQNDIDFYRVSGDDYAALVREIFARCSQHAHDEDCSAVHSRLSMHSTSNEDALLLATRSFNRGLESKIVQLFAFHRQRVTQGVLQAQAKLQHLSSTKRQLLLRFKSVYLSAPAKRFASVLAEADSIIARSTTTDIKKMLVAQFSRSFRIPRTLVLRDSSCVENCSRITSSNLHRLTLRAVLMNH